MRICHSLIDYIAVSGTMERNVLEFVDQVRAGLQGKARLAGAASSNRLARDASRACFRPP